LRDAQKLDQKNAEIFEQIGDLESGQGHAAKARTAYSSALENAQDPQARKRIRKKLGK
jgi:predicted negative regulator of RcsB-dependent stress response